MIENDYKYERFVGQSTIMDVHFPVKQHSGVVRIVSSALGR